MKFKTGTRFKRPCLPKLNYSELFALFNKTITGYYYLFLVRYLTGILLSEQSEKILLIFSQTNPPSSIHIRRGGW